MKTKDTFFKKYIYKHFVEGRATVQKNISLKFVEKYEVVMILISASIVNTRIKTPNLSKQAGGLVCNHQ